VGTHVSAIAPPSPFFTAYCTFKNCNESCLEAPVGPGRKALVGAQLAKLLDFRDFVGLQSSNIYPRNHFYYISIIINGIRFIK
jgi:hypothetical protein